MRMKLLIVLSALLVLFGLMAIRVNAGSVSHPIASAAPNGQPLVVRIYYAGRSDLQSLVTEIDIWAVYPDRGYVEAAVTSGEYFALLAAGYHVEIDADKTAQLNRTHAALPGQTDGIPGFPCYRTVEETFATAQAIVAAHPTLAQWIDVGDTWEKITPGGASGYDLLVLRLTHQAVPGPKPKLFVMSSIHAREYAPAELNTRFAEYLIERYDVDPDVTWLLDYNEIHLLLQANPDGRKKAETGLLWRKNTDNNYCANTNRYGVDLNRNFPFQWGCCGGSSTIACNETYRGPSADSEPETQAVVNYVRGQFPDQRADALNAAAPVTSTGVFMDLHSYGELVLWPWGFTDTPAPNGMALQTLGRKFAYFNGYTAEQAIGLYPTDGTTDDFAYGELGIAAYTFEIGKYSQGGFFATCAAFENDILPRNMPALVYAAKSARQPYLTPAGPDTLNVTASPTTTSTSPLVTLSAVADGTRYRPGEASQNIAAARYSIDAPSWITSVISYPLAASDSSFDNPIEAVQAGVNTLGWKPGRHILFAESQDAAGNWGPPTAVFVRVSGSHLIYLPLVRKD